MSVTSGLRRVVICRPLRGYVSASGTGRAAKDNVAAIMVNHKDVKRVLVGAIGMFHVALTLKDDL